MNVSLLQHKVEAASTPITSEIPDGVQMIRAHRIWDETERGKGIVIAVIDTGCAPHPDLDGRIIGGRNFTAEGGPDDYTDYHGHGTHVAGIIAANQNGAGMVGVAPECSLLVLKALNREGKGNFAAVAAAINYAVDWRGPNGEQVRVVSMSLGGPDDDIFLRMAVQNAVESGVLVICAAGNAGDDNADTDERYYPGTYPEVVQVGGCNGLGEMYFYSNSNDEIDLVAPGVGVYSTYLDGRYVYMTGTSMAAPHVAGAAALIIKQWERDYMRRITEPELYAQIIKRTSPLGHDKRLEGAGMCMVTAGYTAPPKYETITFEEALQRLYDADLIDSPDFWRNMQAKYVRGELTNDDFLYVELVFRKWAASL